MRPSRNSAGKSRLKGNRAFSLGAFTLLEILIATAIFAVVLIAMNTVFDAALKLQRTTTRVVENSIPINHAMTVMKGDLRSMLPAGGTFGGSITGGRGVS